MAKKKKRGAPVGNSNAAKDTDDRLHRFNVAFYIDDWVHWKEVAKAQGLTRAAWIRREMKAAARRWERRKK